MSHLSDIEIARVGSGEGKAALSESALRHLDECDECAILVVEYARSLGYASYSDDADPDDASIDAEELALRPAALARLHEAFVAETAKPGWGHDRAGVHVIELHRIAEPEVYLPVGADEGWVLPAAARPRSELPAFCTEDHRAVVMFTEMAHGEPIRAQLLSEVAWFGDGVALRVQNPPREFQLDATGAADFTGVSADEIREAKIEIVRNLGLSETS